MEGNLFFIYFCFLKPQWVLTDMVRGQVTIGPGTGFSFRRERSLTQMNCDTDVEWEQAVFLWSSIVCFLIISFLVYEQNTSHALIPSQLQHIQMSRFLHARTHTHTLTHTHTHTHTHTGRTAAKSWGLPLSLLPRVPKFFQRGLEIGASHTHTCTHTRTHTCTHLREANRRTATSMKPPPPPSQQITFC